ncbi:transposase [Kitasatospora sp. NPDC036755]|uniref:IS110 family transposase n=1 Tax=Kitasatospora sp. NPDC036755 TaxID=3154600 RepID=UPI0033E8B55C
MTSVTYDGPEITGGVDTHGLAHHAAVIDRLGRHLAGQEFPATVAGYRDLLEWMRSHGALRAVGVEGSGAYGAELARVLTAAGVTVLDVDRPALKVRRLRGKSDPIDAYAATTAVAAGRAVGVPKSRDGVVEAIRVLRCARRSAVKARTQAMNQIRGLLVSPPAVLREQVAGLERALLVRTRPAAARNGPVRAAGRDQGRPAAPGPPPPGAQRRDHRARHRDRPAGQQAAPQLLALFGSAPRPPASSLRRLATIPNGQRSEAAFAHLAEVAPIPASSGRTHRHRLNRGGDRAANNALHIIVLTRVRYDERTRAFVARRAKEGLSKNDITRCLRRFVAREVYRALTSTPSTKITRTDLAPAA